MCMEQTRVADDGSAYHKLDLLCRQYIHDALQVVTHEAQVAAWHLKLLYQYCRTLSPICEQRVTAEDVVEAHADVRPEVELAMACGPQFAKALTSAIPYQELLFPGGSLEIVQPYYRSGLLTSFYN
eukprot:6233165-Prymnesium_polylepis.1